MQFPRGDRGIMEKPVLYFIPPPFCHQGLPPSFFPTFFSCACMFACACLPMHEVHMCVGCTCMCAHVRGQPEVDTENLPQLLSTFPPEAGSSAEPQLTDTASLASHFALGVMGRLPCPPDFHAGFGIWTLATGPSPQIFTCYYFFRHRVYVAQAKFELVILLSQMCSHAWLQNYFFKNFLNDASSTNLLQKTIK